ncbi:hypothetical protein EYB26_002465 [Talaromyces marneffei]|uniref:uncharacterized protein n=1 Tax=Talaromyces marneffei TaxID=37727 RepID=UPI0012A81E89|nr:uncharacterized protein EYB26_002465 [Talaromyces marneffei]QGA14809.1 hypothetical protein EYB26_002465 [Talaromyces marneffei]
MGQIRKEEQAQRERDREKIFEILPSKNKSGLARCRGCQRTWAKNHTRFHQHIESCPAALQLLQRTRQKTLMELPNGIKVDTLETRIDCALARATFTGNRPFSMWSQPFMREALQLLRKGYIPPDRHRIGGSLLTELYTESYTKTIGIWRQIQHLNITVDETSNINHQRVMVITITTPQRSWLYCLKDMENERLNAKNITEWLLHQLEALLATLFDGDIDWKCINSLSTDTCSTMRLVWEILQRKSPLQHAFMIPCDSHGLQLIFKDLLDMKVSQAMTVKHIFKEANDIVTFFHRSPLRYADLQAIEKARNGRKKALIASVITRWGSQYNLINSVNELKESLIQWAQSVSEDSDKSKLVEIIGIIQDITFWNILNDLCRVFKPLHIAQKDSEALNATIFNVIPRWLKLENEMRTAALYTQLHEDIKAYFNEGGFTARANLQILSIHWVAYWLDPKRIRQPLESSTKEKIRAILEPQEVWHDFLHFRQQDGAFYKARCWEESEITIFWLEAADIAPKLASFANRLIHTVANSVTAERAFSLMNLQHTKIRNRLSVEQVEKLLFFTNQ